MFVLPTRPDQDQDSRDLHQHCFHNFSFPDHWDAGPVRIGIHHKPESSAVRGRVGRLFDKDKDKDKDKGKDKDKAQQYVAG